MGKCEDVSTEAMERVSAESELNPERREGGQGHA